MLTRLCWSFPVYRYWRCCTPGTNTVSHFGIPVNDKWGVPAALLPCCYRCCQFFKFYRYDGHVIPHCELKFNILLYNFTNVFYFSFPLICKPLKGQHFLHIWPLLSPGPRQNIVHGTCLVNTCWVGTYSSEHPLCHLSETRCLSEGGLPPTMSRAWVLGWALMLGTQGSERRLVRKQHQLWARLFCAVMWFLPATHGPEEAQSWLSRWGWNHPWVQGHQLPCDPAGSFSEPLFALLLNRDRSESKAVSLLIA